MSWWKTALYDTCSLITLDKLLLERPLLSKQFPKSILALEVSFTVDELRQDTSERIRKLVTICPLPSPTKLVGLRIATGLAQSLSKMEMLIYATAIHTKPSIVTPNKRLAKAVKKKGIAVGNMATILKELVAAKKLSKKLCEQLLIELAARNDYLLRTPSPTWEDLNNYSFPD